MGKVTGSRFVSASKGLIGGRDFRRSGNTNYKKSDPPILIDKECYHRLRADCVSRVFMC